MRGIHPQIVVVRAREPDRLRTHQSDVFDEGQISVNEPSELGYTFHHRLDQYHPDLDLLLRSFQCVQAANRLGKSACALDDVIMEAVMISIERDAPGQGWMQPLEH